ncbi:MAG: hypothetical protein M3Q48_08895 [Actinomycetota bacterium]|nr:hypothetical protein [Actinomycetota bacterium]
MTSCPDCATDRNHCHGVLLVHGDGTRECPECAGPDPAGHDWRAPCEAACCTPVPLPVPVPLAA